MTPRVIPERTVEDLQNSLIRELFARSRTSYDDYRSGRAAGRPAAFWKWATMPAWVQDDEIDKYMGEDEYRVLSKGASGGGFLVIEDAVDQVISAARSQSPIARLAQEYVTGKGEPMSVPIAGTHGTAAWVVESGAITPSDETVTEVVLGAFKANTKLIASEELATDSEIPLDSFLSVELGQRIGALEAAAFATGDGSGKPTGAVSAASTFTVNTALWVVRPRTRRLLSSSSSSSCRSSTGPKHPGLCIPRTLGTWLVWPQLRGI